MVTMGTQRGTSLQTLIGYFELALRSEGKRQATVKYYIYHLRLFLEYAQKHGRKNIGDIDSWSIREYLAYIRDPSEPLGQRRCSRSRAETRAFHHWRGLRAFFSFLLREKLITDDPLENIHVKCPPPQNLPVYVRDELECLNRLCILDFQTASTNVRRAVAGRNHALYLVVLDTGLRLSELAGLQIEDLDVETGVLRVKRGKGGKGRLVRVGDTTRMAILRYIAFRQSESPALWLTEEGKPLTAHGVEQVFDRLCHRAGMKFKGVHAFRRNWCVAALRNGADLRMVQLLGGWSTIDMPVHYSRSLQVEDALEIAARVSPVDHLLAKGKPSRK